MPWVSTYLSGSVFNAIGSRNWFHRPTKLRIATVASPGLAIGSITWKKVRHSPAPSIAAASAIEFDSDLKNDIEEEHGEGEGERRVSDDQPGQRVQQPDALQHEEQRHDRQEDREGQPGEHQVVERPAAGKLEPGEHVRRHRAEQHGQESARRRRR